MSVLFEFMDRFLLGDELMRKHGLNISEYVADFDLKFRKLGKLHIKLPTEILAFKLLRNENLNKQEKIIVLTDVKIEEKENMETKHSLIICMRD